MTYSYRIALDIDVKAFDRGLAEKYLESLVSHIVYEIDGFHDNKMNQDHRLTSFTTTKLGERNDRGAETLSVLRLVGRSAV